MKRILGAVSVLLTLAFALSACGPAAPPSHYAKIQEASKMLVGTSADFPPFELVDESGTIVGFDIALIQEIGKRLKLEVEVQDMPFDSLLAAVQEGKLDLVIAGINATPERDEKVDFSDPYLESQLVLLVPEDFATEPKTYEDVSKFVLGTQTGTTGDTWIVDNLITPGMTTEDKFFRYERVDQGVLDLKAGRIDIYITDNTPAEAFAREMGGLKVIYLGEDISPKKPMNIVVPQGDTELAEALNGVLADLKEEGFIKQLELEWLYK